MGIKLDPPIEIMPFILPEGIPPTGSYILSANGFINRDRGVKCFFNILEGNYSGYRIQAFYTVYDSDDYKRYNAERNLSDFARACGVKVLHDTAQLIDKRFEGYIVTSRHYNGRQYMQHLASYSAIDCNS